MKGASHLAAVAVLAELALSGCSNAPERATAGFGVAAPELRALFRRGGEATAPLRPTPGFPGLDPSLIAGQTAPMMGAYIEDRQALAALVAVETSAGVTSWRTADSIGLAISDRGMLVATRGLGADLLAADVSQTAALVGSGRSGTAQRRQVYLDGVYGRVNVTLTCTVTPMGAETLVLNGRQHRTLRFDERCTGAGAPVVNRYWRDINGPLIRQSSQWIGADVGTVHLQRLIE